MASQHRGQGNTQSSPSQPPPQGSWAPWSRTHLLWKSSSGRARPPPGALLSGPNLMALHLPRWIQRCLPAHSGSQVASCFGNSANPCFTRSHLSLLPPRRFPGAMAEHATFLICPSPHPCTAWFQPGLTQVHGSPEHDDQILFHSPLRLFGQVRGGCCLTFHFSCLGQLLVPLFSFSLGLSQVEWKVCGSKRQQF